MCRDFHAVTAIHRTSADVLLSVYYTRVVNNFSRAPVDNVLDRHINFFVENLLGTGSSHGMQLQMNSKV